MPWNVHPQPSGILAVHAALMHDGRILYFGGDQHSGNLADINNTRIFDPAAPDANNSIATINSPATDVFCSGHAYLADGRLLVAGGTEEWGLPAAPAPGHDPNHPHFLNFGGERGCWVYHPRENHWRRVADMHFQPGRTTGGGRWYPTLVTLSNGEVIAFSGHPSRRTPAGQAPQTPPGDSRHNNNTPERFSPGNFWTLVGGDIVHTGDSDGNGFYPRAHLLRDGNIYIGMPVNGSYRIYDPFAGVLRAAMPAAGGVYDGWNATSVMLPLLPSDDYRPRILVAGGAMPKLLDLGTLSPLPSGPPPSVAWADVPRQGMPPENRVREYGMLVLLPTGEILMCGGVHQVGTGGGSPTPELAMMESEIYSPPISWMTDQGTYNSAVGTWQTDPNPSQVIRNYHSVALLMPDGRVWTAGSSKKAAAGDPNDATIAEKRIEIYSPGYMAEARPTYSGATPFVRYGETFTITSPEAATIQRIAMIRCGSITHAFDADQRYVGVRFTRSGNTLTITAPPHASVAPPGNYMLWIVNASNVPCQRAAIVRLTTAQAFVLEDRSSFSVHEVASLGNPADFAKALYLVVEGLLPHELDTLTGAPAPTVRLDGPGGAVSATITAVPNGPPLWEVPSRPADVPQRLTFAFDLRIAGTSEFLAGNRTVHVAFAFGRFSAAAEVTLTQQPNPYMSDGPVEWLSTDVRVFQVRPGLPGPHGVTFGAGDTAFTFLQNQLNHFNSGAAGEAAFNLVPTDQAQSPLEPRDTVGGTPVYNFAFARVHYRSTNTNAENVRVMFRLFNTVGTALEWNAAPNATYDRHIIGGSDDARPLLGMQGANIISIPFYDQPRVTPGTSMTSQPDGNVHTLVQNGTSERVRIYGVYLDINRTQPRIPRHPMDSGPYDPAECQSIAQLVADLHQCLVCEIYYLSPDPMATPLLVSGDTPGSSDRLSQRNLAIVPSANPGGPATRTIQHTFEVRSSESGLVSFGQLDLNMSNHRAKRVGGPDELLFTWNSTPRDAVCTVYFPSVDAAEILRIAATRPGPGNLEMVDAHTIRFTVGDVTWVPLPPGGGENIAGLLSIELPPGVTHGDRYDVVVQQYSGISRRIIGAFQLTIPVTLDDLLPQEAVRLSLLRWKFEAMGPDDRWYPVYLRYLPHIEDRVRGFGGNPVTIEPSPNGDGKRPEPQDSRDHECRCRSKWLFPMLLAMMVVLLGVLAPKWALVVGTGMSLLLVAAYCCWRNECKPARCEILHAMLMGLVIGGGFLALGVLLGVASPFVLSLVALLAALLMFVAVVAGCIAACSCDAHGHKHSPPRDRWWARAMPKLRQSHLPADISVRTGKLLPPSPMRGPVDQHHQHGGHEH